MVNWPIKNIGSQEKYTILTKFCLKYLLYIKFKVISKYKTTFAILMEEMEHVVGNKILRVFTVLRIMKIQRQKCVLIWDVGT